MENGKALIKAVKDRPSDDTPRLVRADFLDDEGGEKNAKLATLIRGDCQDARIPFFPSKKFNKRRVKVINAIHASWREKHDALNAELFKEENEKGIYPDTHRGFVDRLILENSNAIYAARHIFEDNPVTHLACMYTGGAGDVSPTLLSEDGKHIDTLSLYELEYVPHALQKDSPFLPQLKKLCISVTADRGIGEEINLVAQRLQSIFLVIATHSRLHKLEDLSLTYAEEQFNDDEFRLAYNRFRLNDAIQFVQNPSLIHLRFLTLPEETAQIISLLKHFNPDYLPALETLNGRPWSELQEELPSGNADRPQQREQLIRQLILNDRKTAEAVRAIALRRDGAKGWARA